MPGEFDFIQWIRQQQSDSSAVAVGIGDDLAALRWPSDDLLLVGVDQVLDDVHFDLKLHEPGLIGRKAMNRNLSDCAAMGCLPAAAVATVALPRDFPLESAKAIYLGMRQAGDAFDCPIVGGDTGVWDGRLAVTVTILGKSAGVPPVTRGGAKAGDGIFVTGPLGGSILGRHMTFTPRVEQGRRIAARATAMIDLSDGLSRDLRQICAASGVGAVIEAERVPIHPDAIALSQRDGIPPLQHALHDGEDYELLFTASSSDAIRIGTITHETAITLRDRDGDKPLMPAGWQHAIME